MVEYRLDPKSPPQLTEEEARRLDKAPIDLSDIPELDDEFFSRAGYLKIENRHGRLAGKLTEQGRMFDAWMALHDRRRSKAPQSEG